MAGAVACVLILVLVVTLGGGRGVRAHTRAHASSGAEVPRVARTRVASHHAAAPATAPGSLPQTHAEPSTAGRAFAARMSALWSRVRNDSTAHAMSAFFPEQAYVQVKAEGAPEADWQERLVGDFRLDLHAAHALLGADSAGATLIAVRADGAYAHWVAPGACFNRVGYWELPNARLVSGTSCTSAQWNARAQPASSTPRPAARARPSIRARAERVTLQARRQSSSAG